MNPAKLHPSLAAAMSIKGFDGDPVPVILQLRPGAIARGEMSALSQVPVIAEFRLLAARAVAVTTEMIDALTDDPAVAMIWPDLQVHTWLDRAVPLVQAPRVWDSGFTGRGVKIAVVDTGLDGDHPDFADRIVAWRDLVDPVPRDDGLPRDPNGHGTHVAGIAAGSGSASAGRYRGIAPEAQLIVARVLDDTGNGRTSTVMAGIEWAVAQGANVINVSLGGPPYPADGTDAFSLLCNAAVAQGVVVCVAAGNLGPSGHTIGSPAAATDVVTVGACTGSQTQTDQVAPFSSRGPVGDGRAKPDLVFPGVGVVSTRAVDTTLGSPVDRHHTAISGTSQATPMATGTVALLLQANPRLAPADIKARLQRGARSLGEASAVVQGSGRGDTYNTFISAAGVPVSEAPPAPSAPTDPSDARPDTRAGCLTAMATAFVAH